MFIADKIPKEECVVEGICVKVNGKTVDVYSARVSAYPLNQLWPGYQRPEEQTEKVYFLRVLTNESLYFEVKTEKVSHEVKIRPLSKKIEVNQKDKKISFTLCDIGQYVLEVGDHHFALHIFIDKFEDCTNLKKEATHYFPKGVYCIGQLEVKSGDCIYIEKGAIVYGTLLGSNIENVLLCGGGILDGSKEKRDSSHCYEQDSGGCIRFYNSKHIVIKDIILRDSANWIISMFECSNIEIDNVKEVGHWRYNTDGIDLVNCCDCKIRNSFIRSFDDGIVLKGIPGGEHKNVENILIENCIVWCDWGRSLEIGAETVADWFKNITFRNCDLIHNSAVCMDVQNRSNAEIHDVLFENIRVEYSKFCTKEQVQTAKGQRYTRGEELNIPVLIRIENSHYEDWDFSCLYPYGECHDIKFKNIYIYRDSEVGQLCCEFLGVNAENQIYNIVIENLRVDGKRELDEKTVKITENKYTNNICLV